MENKLALLNKTKILKLLFFFIILTVYVGLCEKEFWIVILYVHEVLSISIANINMLFINTLKHS